MEKNFISKLKSISTRFNGSSSEPPRNASHGSNGSPATNGNNRGNEKRPRSTASEPIVPLNEADEPQSSTPRDRFRQVTHRVSEVYHRYPLHRRPLFWLGLLVVGGGGTLAWGYWSLEKTLPNTSDIASFVRDGTLTIKAADGSVLQQLGPATRDKLAYDRIPDKVVKAFVAAEDRRFYQHTGVDYQSVVRATVANLMSRDVVEGGSTITQQLARVVYLNQERSVGRKLQEAMLAQKIERELKKEEILEKYLNFVYLGSGAYGVADAAWVYFSKPVNQLTLSEIATIAGLPPAPSDYSPLVSPEAARQRRSVVLERMQEAGFITADEAAAARSQPLTLKPSLPKKLFSDTPYFTSYIQKELPKYVSKDQLEIGGLTVETTLNPKWQKIADKVVTEAVQYSGAAEGFEQAALVAIDPRNGEIRAMVGGTDFNKSQFNRVTQAQRQPGSSFKTILYTAAIATGMSPYDGYLDAPFRVDGYEPLNYGRKYSGWLSLREALTNSVNVISVKLLLDVGFDPLLKLAKDMGIKSKLMPTYSLALGASEVNLLELVSSYGTLAAQGKHIETHGIRRIFNRKGEIIYNSEYKPKQVVDKVTAAIVTWMMQSVVNSGTGRAAQLDRPVAGKTGTSEQARDLWFVGFIPQLVTGVWLGNDDNAPTWSASATAALVWHDFMSGVTKGMPVQKFPELPKVDGRKGSIKAKPVSAQRGVGSGVPSSESSGGSQSGGGGGNSGGTNDRRYEEPAPAAEPAPSRNEAPPPAAESAPAPAAEPAPAEPAPPAAEPAPAEPAAEPAPPPPDLPPAGN